MIKRKIMTEKSRCLPERPTFFISFKDESLKKGGGNITNQPALACAEQSGRISIGYQHEMT